MNARTVRWSRGPYEGVKFPLAPDDPNRCAEVDGFEQKLVCGDFDHLDSISLGHKLMEVLLKKKDRENPEWKRSLVVVGPPLWID